MKDPVTAETWQTAFGKNFGGMCQGDNKTGTVGTDAMFVMTPHDVDNMPADRFATYANIVIDFRLQKEDPHRIQITAGGNLINHPGELTTRTADITTSKLHWNSVLSTQKAKYVIKLPCSIYIMLYFQKGRQNFVFLFRLLGKSNRAGAINDRYSGILIHSWMHSSLTRPGLADIHFLLDSQR